MRYAYDNSWEAGIPFWPKGMKQGRFKEYQRNNNRQVHKDSRRRRRREFNDGTFEPMRDWMAPAATFAYWKTIRDKERKKRRWMKRNGVEE